jgi:hypothetical protein
VSRKKPGEKTGERGYSAENRQKSSLGGNIFIMRALIQEGHIKCAGTIHTFSVSGRRSFARHITAPDLPVVAAGEKVLSN